MRDLVALLIALAALATLIEAARCRDLPRMYGGGVDLADWPPADQWRQP